MPNRAPRLVVAAAICVAAVAALPALGEGATGAVGEVSASPGQALSTQPTPAPRDAHSSVSNGRIRRHHNTPVVRKAVHGRAAVEQLGPRLGEVAARTGWSQSKLKSVLAQDDSAYVAPEGRVYYRENDVPQQSTTDPSRAETVAPVYPTNQTFQLHSRPGASRTIFLDFDGANVSNTGWNGTSPGDVPNGNYGGFDRDGNPATFNTAEHGYVQEVWREVTESYAPYDVDVTTQDPGLAGITRSSSSDTTYGTHVLVTSDPAPRADVCGSCLGVAWVGTFDNIDAGGYYQPAWVFDYSTSFDPMIIAQAASHETGHTLGLSHDGTSSASYYSGTSAWGPLMGSSMNRAVSQWSKGEYTGANNTEDDLAVIASNGLPMRADDHTGVTELGSQASYDVSGVIATRTDTDDFALTLPCTTSMTVAARGIGAQTALDLSLTVLDGIGQVVASSSPASTRAGSPPVSAGMNASVTVPNATGDYVLRVDGVGNGSPASGGWSDYASLGRYTLTASGCEGTTPTETPTGTPTETPTGTPTETPTGTPTDGPTTDPTGTPNPAPTATPTASVPPKPVQHHAPKAPRIGTVSPGAPRGPRTATVRWYAPSDTGGATITSYRLRAQRLDARHRVRAVYVTRLLRATPRGVTVRLPRGFYRFQVAAANSVGSSPWSVQSRIVRAR